MRKLLSLWTKSEQVKVKDEINYDKTNTNKTTLKRVGKDSRRLIYRPTRFKVDTVK